MAAVTRFFPIARFVVAAVHLAGIGFRTRSADGAESPVRLFTDAALESAVRSQVFSKRNSVEPLVEADVVNVSTVVAKGSGIRRLDGLERCRNLVLLDLGANHVVDLGPLSGLSRLQYLDVRGNRVSSLVPLGGVTTLQYLNGSSNLIEDLSPIRGLTNLTVVFLGRNRISDLGPLKDLRKLGSLYLEDNRIASVEGIAGFEALTSLSLGGNRLSDLRPLVGLNSLRFLFLERNRIQDLSVLVGWLGEHGDRNPAPYLRMGLEGNPLGTEARRRQVGALKSSGVRLIPQGFLPE